MTENIPQTENKKDWESVLQDPWANLERMNPEIKNYKEFTELRDWYELRVKQLPEFQVEDAPLADGNIWQSSIKTDSETSYNKEVTTDTLPVDKIKRKDGQFYSVEGRNFKKINDDGTVMFSWNQPVLISQETPIDIKVFGEKMNVPVNGFLGVIKDTDGRVLTVVDQEAMAETPNHAIIRLAIQASGSKIALMRSGKPEADKQLSELLKIYGNGDIEDLFEKAEYILPIAPEDTNRDLKHNLVLIMKPVESDSNIHSDLEAGGTRKWLTPEQIALTNIARLTNSHTMAAVKIGEDARLLRAFR